jgi:hypothetical protein
MADGKPMFGCASCNRSYAWKPEIAGKRAKCKCGNVMTVPDQAPAPPAPPEPQADDGMYDFAEPAPTKSPPKTAPKAASPSLPSFARTNAARAAAVPGAAAPAAAKPAPLNYQRGPTDREKFLASDEVLVDRRRDYHAPIALLVTGVLLYMSYYTIHYSLGPAGILTTGIGLIIVTVLETAALVGFAFVVAGPLGVSFGSVGTAILKLAATVVLCDGIITVFDAAMLKILGVNFGGGFFGFGAFGLPIVVLTYLCCFIYLFSMDPGDARTVVMVLSVFYRVLRLVLFLLLLNAILSFSGVHKFANATSASNPVTDAVEDAKSRGLLEEGKQYTNDHGMYIEGEYVKEWYDAGCKNVWFQVSRDINGHGTALDIVLELPDDPTARAKCFDVEKKYYDKTQQFYDPKLMKDNGDPYEIVSLPFK